MSIPVWVLLGFAAWTLLTLTASIGVYRWSRILTGRASVAEWRADVAQGSDWYQRAMRAHMNCIENLPVYTAIVVALVATGLQSSTIDRLAITMLIAARRPDAGPHRPDADQCGKQRALRALLRPSGVHDRHGHHRGHARVGLSGRRGCPPRRFLSRHLAAQILHRRLHAAADPCGMASALRPISTAPSVPSTIGALVWPMWAMRKALPSSSPRPTPRITPHLSRRVVEQRLGVAALHQDAGDGIGALGRVGDVERQHLALGPLGDGGARRLGQQRVAADGVRQALLLEHVDGLAQAEQQVLRRRAAVLLVVDLALAEGPVPVERAQAGASCARRAPDRWRRRRPGPAASSGPSASRHMATSTPQPSMSKGMQPSEATQSTISRAGCLAASIGLADGGDVVDDAGGRIDLHHQHGLDGVALVAPQPLLERRRIDGAAPVALSTSTSTPIILAISPQPRAKRPLSSASTVSPRESTLVSAASQPPWPLAA